MHALLSVILFLMVTNASRSSPALPATSMDNERHLGYRAALRDAVIDRNAKWEARGNFSEDSGFEAARALLKLRSRPTAIFAANDSMAIGALSALREAGVSVPEDIAVAGFDDIPIARHINPPLTSVHVPIAELGERATAKLLAALGDKSTARPPPRRAGHHSRNPLLMRPSRPYMRYAITGGLKTGEEALPVFHRSGVHAEDRWQSSSQQQEM